MKKKRKMDSSFPLIFLQALTQARILYNHMPDFVLAWLLIHPDTHYVLVEEKEDTIIFNIEMTKPMDTDNIKFEAEIWEEKNGDHGKNP